MDNLDKAWNMIEELSQAIAEEDSERIHKAHASLTLALNEYRAGKASTEKVVNPVVRAAREAQKSKGFRIPERGESIVTVNVGDFEKAGVGIVESVERAVRNPELIVVHANFTVHGEKRRVSLFADQFRVVDDGLPEFKRKTEEEVLFPARYFFAKEGSAWKACADKAVDTLKDNLEKADLAKALTVFKDLEDLLDPAVADKFVPSISPATQDVELPDSYVEKLRASVTQVVPVSGPGPVRRFLQAIGRALLFRRKVVATAKGGLSGPLPFSGAGMTPEGAAEVKKIEKAKEAQRGRWKDHLEEPANPPANEPLNVAANEAVPPKEEPKP